MNLDLLIILILMLLIRGNSLKHVYIIPKYTIYMIGIFVFIYTSTQNDFLYGRKLRFMSMCVAFFLSVKEYVDNSLFIVDCCLH